MDRMIRIYALSGPDMQVKYVGQTGVCLRERLLGHIGTSKRGKRPLDRWILEMGDHIVMRELERADWGPTPYKPSIATELENKWIKHFLKEGCRLFNINQIKRHLNIITLEDEAEADASRT